MSWPYYIAWEKLTWEAVATFAAGAMAVTGATIIGLRQVKVAERQAEMTARQAEIAHRQALLADLEVRTQLFERRLRVYKATEAFLVAVLQKLSEPEQDIKWAFLNAKTEAPLLFKRDVKARLDQLWTDASEAWQARREIGIYAVLHPDKVRQNADAFSALDRVRQNLPDLFGDEIRLSVHDDFADEA